VLDLDVSKTFEASFVGSGQKTEGVEEAKWWLNTKFALESVQGAGLGSLLDRGESSSGRDKGGKDGGLHDVVVDLFRKRNCEPTVSDKRRKILVASKNKRWGRQ